jgi:hypothetical protein
MSGGNSWLARRLVEQVDSLKISNVESIRLLENTTHV